MPQISVRITRGMRRIEARKGIEIESFLRRRYESEGATQEQIAAEH